MGLNLAIHYNYSFVAVAVMTVLNQTSIILFIKVFHLLLLHCLHAEAYYI